MKSRSEKAHTMEKIEKKRNTEETLQRKMTKGRRWRERE
jgi:hypothetical protein